MERPSFHIFRQLLGWGQVWLKRSGILLDNTLLLTTILTNVIEILSHSEAGHFYLWSREDPFLVVANGNIHHPVIMALKKSRVLRGSRGKKKTFERTTRTEKQSQEFNIACFWKQLIVCPWFHPWHLRWSTKCKGLGFMCISQHHMCF